MVIKTVVKIIKKLLLKPWQTIVGTIITLALSIMFILTNYNTQTNAYDGAVAWVMGVLMAIFCWNILHSYHTKGLPGGVENIRDAATTSIIFSCAFLLAIILSSLMAISLLSILSGATVNVPENFTRDYWCGGLVVFLIFLSMLLYLCMGSRKAVSE